MLGIYSRSAFMLAMALSAAGCIDFDFGGGDTEVKGCSAATPHSVTDDLESRYALGSRTTLYLSDLDNPRVTSSDPEVVSVGRIEPDARDEDEDRLVEIGFVGVGTAVLTVSESGESTPAQVPLEVAALERFEVVLPTGIHSDPVVPLAGKTVIDPELEVIYYDRVGRLHGRGLAQTDWERTTSLTDDAFFNDTLDSGPQSVEVRAGRRRSVIPFAAVAHDDVIALELLETELDEGLIRVDLVGLTEAGTSVWNIDPVFAAAGNGLYLGSFDYFLDPDAAPTELSASAWALSDGTAFDPVETTFHGEPAREGSFLFNFGSVGGHTPVMALVSLLMTALALRGGRRQRFGVFRC